MFSIWARRSLRKEIQASKKFFFPTDLSYSQNSHKLTAGHVGGKTWKKIWFLIIMMLYIYFFCIPFIGYVIILRKMPSYMWYARRCISRSCVSNVLAMLLMLLTDLSRKHTRHEKSSNALKTKRFPIFLWHRSQFTFLVQHFEAATQ